MRVGEWQIETLVDGSFALDGGSMFGVVPKALWERGNPADDRNRIALASRLLLLRGESRIVLVDTGLGHRWSDKERDIYAIDRSGPDVVGQLAARGIDIGDVTDVILTHLHFDHAAGTVREGDGGLELTFAAARHHLQRRHWEWAQSPTPKDTASFRPDDFRALADSPLLELRDGPGEVLPGVEVLPLDGHTDAMQAVKVSGPEATLLYVADLVPTTAHLRLPFVMAYDNRPLRTLQEKRELLSTAAREDWILVLEHDPDTGACSIAEREGRMVLDEVVPL